MPCRYANKPAMEEWVFAWVFSSCSMGNLVTANKDNNAAKITGMYKGITISFESSDGHVFVSFIAIKSVARWMINFVSRLARIQLLHRISDRINFNSVLIWISCFACCTAVTQCNPYCDLKIPKLIMDSSSVNPDWSWVVFMFFFCQKWSRCPCDGKDTDWSLSIITRHGK